MLESNSALSMVKFNSEACYAKCANEKVTNFLTIKETLCFRNCFTKTNSCLRTVMDNLENSGVTFYRELNEKEALRANPALAALNKDSYGNEIDAELGFRKPLRSNLSRY